MEKYHLFTLAVLIALAVIQWLGIYWELWKTTDVLSIVPFFTFTAMVGIILWDLRESIEKKVGKTTTSNEKPVQPKLERGFSHLAVPYLRVKGLPDTPISAHLRYVTNSWNRRAFQLREIPEWLEPLIREHRITWLAYDDMHTLRSFLTSNYSVTNIEPLPEHLGFLIEGKELRVLYELHPVLLENLKGTHLDDLELRILTRRYFKSIKRRYFLIQFFEDGSHPKAWLAPSVTFELVINGIIKEETKGLWFWQTCESWCKRKGYICMDEYFPEDTLLDRS